MHLFLMTGSEHDEIIWAGAYHKCDQRRLRRDCDFVMPMHLFLMTGSEHDEIIWAGAYHKCDQRRLRRDCDFVQLRQGIAAHKLKSFELDKDYGRKSLDIYVLPLISCALNMRTSILYEFG